MLFLWYPKCSTCQKARAWLDKRGVVYEARDIQSHHPTHAELVEWHRRSGLPLKRFFNTSGLSYKALNLSQRFPTLTEEEQCDLLAADGMLVKRPIIVTEDTVLVGFQEQFWETVVSK